MCSSDLLYITFNIIDDIGVGDIVRCRPFQHRAGVSTYTSALAFADTCVFAKQSLVTILCGLLSQAPLLPKLRGHFAEFLGNTSSAGLRILSSSTCVGLRYGYGINDSGFS